MDIIQFPHLAGGLKTHALISADSALRSNRPFSSAGYAWALEYPSRWQQVVWGVVAVDGPHQHPKQLSYMHA